MARVARPVPMGQVEPQVPTVRAERLGLMDPQALPALMARADPPALKALVSCRAQ